MLGGHCSSWMVLSCLGVWDLSPPTRDRTCVPWMGRRIFNPWTFREVPPVLSLTLSLCWWGGQWAWLSPQVCPRHNTHVRCKYVRKSPHVREYLHGFVTFPALCSELRVAQRMGPQEKRKGKMAELTVKQILGYRTVG